MAPLIAATRCETFCHAGTRGRVAPVNSGASARPYSPIRAKMDLAVAATGCSDATMLLAIPDQFVAPTDRTPRIRACRRLWPATADCRIKVAVVEAQVPTRDRVATANAPGKGRSTANNPRNPALPAVPILASVPPV
jgi:hypothetical protein